MTEETAKLIDKLIRHGKGVCAAFEEWLQSVRPKPVNGPEKTYTDITRP